MLDDMIKIVIDSEFPSKPAPESPPSPLYPFPGLEDSESIWEEIYDLR
jgi:hypothetical protein